MIEFGNAEIQELAKEVFDGAESCDEHKTNLSWISLAGKAIAAYMEYGDYSESNGVAVFKMDDGKFCVVEQWEDTTGHGCQCGGTVKFYDDYQSMLSEGLSKNDKNKLNIKAETQKQGVIAMSDNNELEFMVSEIKSVEQRQFHSKKEFVTNLTYECILRVFENNSIMDLNAWATKDRVGRVVSIVNNAATALEGFGTQTWDHVPERNEEDGYRIN